MPERPPVNRDLSRFDVLWLALQVGLFLLAAMARAGSWPPPSLAWIYASMGAVFIGAIVVQVVMKVRHRGGWWLAPVGPGFGARAVGAFSLLLAGLLLGLWIVLLVAGPRGGSRTVLAAGLVGSVAVAGWLRYRWPRYGSALVAAAMTFGFIATAAVSVGLRGG